MQPGKCAVGRNPAEVQMFQSAAAKGSLRHFLLFTGDLSVVLAGWTELLLHSEGMSAQTEPKHLCRHHLVMAHKLLMLAGRKVACSSVTS